MECLDEHDAVVATVQSGDRHDIEIVSECFEGAWTEKGPFTTSVEFSHWKKSEAPSIRITFKSGRGFTVRPRRK